MPQHVVDEGECLASIGLRYGFHPDTLWNLDENATLREKRDSAYVLAAGDMVVIPEKRMKRVAIATAANHRFRRLGVPEKLRLQIRSGDRPRAGAAYTLDVDGHVVTGTTDAEGWIEQWIAPNSAKATVKVGRFMKLHLDLGRLDPVGLESGVRARLVNLRFLAAGASAEDLEAALRAFQRAHGLTVTGHPDDDTKQKLREAHTA